MYACRSLVQSALQEHVEWLPLDTTQLSVPPPPWSSRLRLGLARLAAFRRTLRVDGAEVALIFSSYGSSLLEKGVMALLARRAGLGVVFCPRSGHILPKLERSRFWRGWTRMVLSRVHRVVCQSASWREVYVCATGLPDVRFTVVKNWIDTRPYRELALPRGRPPVRVLFLGAIEKNKGVYELLEMVHQRRADLTGARFVLCGCGSEFAGVQERLRALSLSACVDLPGWVKGAEKFRQLEEADIFVLPSFREGFPNALLEAMAAGRAVVASAVGGVPELVVDPGLGRLIPAGNVRDLGEAVVELARDGELRLALGRKARAHVVAEHDINRVWPLMWRVLQEAADQSGAGAPGRKPAPAAAGGRPADN
jgi:glycosyltransferase involved in cell wall biosynthesis